MDRTKFLEIATKTIRECLEVCAESRDKYAMYLGNVQKHEPKIWFCANDGKCYDIISLRYDKVENKVTYSALEWESKDGNRVLRMGCLDDLNFANIMALVNMVMWRTIRTEY